MSRIVSVTLLLEVDDDGFDTSRLHDLTSVEFADDPDIGSDPNGWVEMPHMEHQPGPKSPVSLMRVKVDGLTRDQRETVHYLHDHGQSIDDIVDQTGYQRSPVKWAVENYAK